MVAIVAFSAASEFVIYVRMCTIAFRVNKALDFLGWVGVHTLQSKSIYKNNELG